jgi:ATP-binding cassette subfamily F protein 3
VLLLDEPTNHLDFETVEALAEALRAYDGTLFFVSHDRGFVERLATHVLEVKDGQVTSYPDGYAAYCWRLEREVGGETAKPKEAAKSVSQAPARSAQDHRDSQKRIKGIERELKQLDQQRKTLEAAIAATYDTVQHQELSRVQERIAALEEEWLALSEA